MIDVTLASSRPPKNTDWRAGLWTVLLHRKTVQDFLVQENRLSRRKTD
jgi:hypothetical protein